MAELLDIGDIYEQMNMSSDVDQIDRYVLSQIGERNLKSTKDVYGQIVQEMRGTLGLDPNLEFDSVVSALAAYARMKEEVVSTDKMRMAYA